MDPEADRMMGELAKVVRSIEPEGEREKLVSHLRGLYGPSTQMNPTQIDNALVIAKTWPADVPGREDEPRVLEKF